MVKNKGWDSRAVDGDYNTSKKADDTERFSWVSANLGHLVNSRWALSLKILSFTWNRRKRMEEMKWGRKGKRTGNGMK